jgi:Glycosyl transferase family 2.
MQLSVVVPTLNGRDQLLSCLDRLTAEAPDAEIIVVNGPTRPTGRRGWYATETTSTY